MSHRESGNKQWPQYLTVYTALLAMFGAGIHLGWPSPSLPRIFSDEYPFEVTAEEASYITIIGPVGDIFGNLVSSLLVDLIGRKWTILLIGVPQVVSMLMIYFSTHSVVLLYAARFIGGMSEGACFTILPLYICEVTEPQIRGLLGASFSLSLVLGTLFSNVIGSFCTLYTAALIYLGCSVIFVLSFSAMPESPFFLLMKNEDEKANDALQRLRHNKEVTAELSSLRKDVTRQMSEKGSFKDLFTIKSNKMALTAMTILRLVQQFSGASSFTFYAQLLFKDATDAIPQKYAAIIMIVVQAVFNVVAVVVIDIAGRKPMILVSISGCFFTLSTCTIFFALRDLTDVQVNDLTLVPLVMLMLFVMFFALGLGSAVNLMLGELFAASVKAKAASLMNIILAVSMLVSTKFYQYMADEFTVMIPFGVFALIQLVGFGLCWVYVPETKNKTLEEIQQELKGNKDVAKDGVL